MSWLRPLLTSRIASDLCSEALAWDKARDEFAARWPKTGPLMATMKAEVLAFAAFPRAQWRKI